MMWASGNGHQNGDSCAADGYVNSIYTVAVGSVDQRGQRAFYDEECSAKMVVVFNYNRPTSQRGTLRTHTVSSSRASQIARLMNYSLQITTGVGSECRESFVGTSASCSLASGAIALALQAK